MRYMHCSDVKLYYSQCTVQHAPNISVPGEIWCVDNFCATDLHMFSSVRFDWCFFDAHTPWISTYFVAHTQLIRLHTHRSWTTATTTPKQVKSFDWYAVVDISVLHCDIQLGILMNWIAVEICESFFSHLYTVMRLCYALVFVWGR